MHFSEIMIFSSRFGDVIYATELGLVPDELLVNDLRPLLTQSSLKYQKHSVEWVWLSITLFRFKNLAVERFAHDLLVLHLMLPQLRPPLQQQPQE